MHALFNMDLANFPPPRGGKRIYFDEPLSAYASKRRKQIHLQQFQLSHHAPSIFQQLGSTPSASQQPHDPSPVPIKIPTQLIQAYEQRRIATTLFPPEISLSCVRDRISHFEDHIAAAIAATQKICGSCGRFILKKVFQLSKNNLLLQQFYTKLDTFLRLDSCALIENNYLFCHSCYNIIQ